MELKDAVKARATTYRFTPQDVPEDMIKRIIEAGTWAPNRHLTEPWRFWVLTENGRVPLSKTMKSIAEDIMAEAPDEERNKRIETYENLPFRAPVNIIVACEVTENPKVIPVEETAAVNACIQNMLLTAADLGLGAFWGTGNYVYHPQMKELLGLKDKDQVIGVVYIGYAEANNRVRKRTPFSNFTKWVKEDTSYI
ncbi:nitroreductase family protein [Clostridium polynesiense]|uniref:nitroreductase family protein n=1 Tax=Clostridium polynesiense TaxID=1325933 RepID=UPI00058DC591|nr:nitroreductase [Clostridium polynesiense]